MNYNYKLTIRRNHNIASHHHQCSRYSYCIIRSDQHTKTKPNFTSTANERNQIEIARVKGGDEWYGMVWHDMDGGSAKKHL